MQEGIEVVWCLELGGERWLYLSIEGVLPKSEGDLFIGTAFIFFVFEWGGVSSVSIKDHGHADSKDSRSAHDDDASGLHCVLSYSAHGDGGDCGPLDVLEEVRWVSEALHSTFCWDCAKPKDGI